eukprot:CAMPEP_0178907898 /NCGR_PEP_ID=MMETSP0786-20121207/7623_1 /TAXON_ID=186022 /ORGANISM="Thalassionema frauenfeldii, Strain CCMP 1798" /LENGTH=459 /DNA_ID=CAMNT_0020579741 /DNA_START=137 /DNA_END=1516 /DNA_ORIENTATION=+
MMERETLELEENKNDGEHVVVPDPHADKVDLSELRGTRAPDKGREQMLKMKDEAANDELEALAELVPELKSKASKERENHTMTVDVNEVGVDVVPVDTPEGDNCAVEVVEKEEKEKNEEGGGQAQIIIEEGPVVESPQNKGCNWGCVDDEDVKTEGTRESQKKQPIVTSAAENDEQDTFNPQEGLAKLIVQESPEADASEDHEQNLGGFDDVDSENALQSDQGVEAESGEVKAAGDLYQNISSAASLSTATQTHEVRMPMYLPTFKPATGCTNASDFIVRCFVARLRSGITVVKHGRSRWCKSRLRILHIHPDGRSLSWKPAVGEPTSSKRPPKLDLSTCVEVRHAWSPDPLNPMFTGTAILRQKCEAANAHKSFALIFAKRTVDITAVTADQCKVLMEGFSALCFRLQVANLAGRGAKKVVRSSDEDETETTRSMQTNNSTTQLNSPASRFKRSTTGK